MIGNQLFNRINKKKIEFIASSEEVQELVNPPVPASSLIPEWYKKSFKYHGSNKPVFNDHNNIVATIKSCMPVLDVITAGYILQTWCDIYIEVDEEENIFFRWASEPQVIHLRDKLDKQLLPTPPGHYDAMFAWPRPWAIKTPRGWSSLLIQPAYRDLPFTTFPGIIDSDVYNGPGILSVPFFIKKGFSGLIPKGTPMYQIIPFKRESWKPTIREYGYKGLTEKHHKMINSKFYDRYKKMFWIRKSYS